MSFSSNFIKAFKSVLPAPFTIAVILTVVTWFLAFFFGEVESTGFLDRVFKVAQSWEVGVWKNSLLVFAVQMMLMLVLGHSLARSKPMDSLIQKALKYCTNTANSAAIVVFLSMFVGLFNWGLGLIFGAIFARKVGEKAVRENNALNYPLIGAAGYSALLVWHGGLSGSSLTKVAEPNHLRSFMEGIYSSEKIALLPEQITFSETVFSPMNVVVSIALLTIIPLVIFQIGKRSKTAVIKIKLKTVEHSITEKMYDASLTPEGLQKLADELKKTSDTLDEKSMEWMEIAELMEGE